MQQIVPTGIGSRSFLQVQVGAGHTEDAKRSLAFVDSTVLALWRDGTVRQTEVLVGSLVVTILPSFPQNVGQFVLERNRQAAGCTSGFREYAIVGLGQAIATYVTIHQPAFAKAPLVIGHVLV